MARRAYTPKGTSAQDSASLQALPSAFLSQSASRWLQLLAGPLSQPSMTVVTNLVGLKMASKRLWILAQE